MKKLLIIVSIILTVVACGKSDKKTELDKLISQHDKLAEQIASLQKELASESGDSTVKITLVEVSAVKTGEFNHYVEVQGKVDGDDNIYVAPKMSGIVTEVYVKEGDVVRKGQILAQMDDAIIKQGIDELKTQQSFVNNLYLKQKNLWDKKIGSEMQFLTAKNNKESVDNKMKSLNEQLALTKIIAPITGSIEEVSLKVGQVATPAPNMPAFRMVNFSNVKVTAEVAEAYSPKVSKGDKVIINFPDYNEEVETTISFSSKFINPTNRTFTIESRLKPGKMVFRANMIALVKINDYKNPNTVVIPVNIIQKNATEKYVYIAETSAKKKVAKKRIIKTGLDYNGNVEILEGLNDGDQIIVTGFQDLEDGKAIQF